MYKKSFVFGVIATSLLLASQASAHATIKPSTAGIGKFQSFTLSAPSEKSVSTIGLRLVLPDGLNHITPNVKPGWKINIKKQGAGKIIDDHGKITEEQKIVEITWTGGNIPAGMRDDFLFSAQVPSQPTTLNWKVYQTYANGTVVAWDKDPSAPKDETGDFSKSGPYSKTEIINDLAINTSTSSLTEKTGGKDMTAVWLSLAAVLVSLAALKKATKQQV